MARVDRFLRYQPPGRGLMRRQARRDHELRCLFGRRTVTQARRTDLADLSLTSDRVAAVMTAADELLTHTGDVEAQRAAVDRLDDVTKTVLCLWIDDASTAATLLDRYA